MTKKEFRKMGFLIVSLAGYVLSFKMFWEYGGIKLAAAVMFLLAAIRLEDALRREGE